MVESAAPLPITSADVQWHSVGTEISISITPEQAVPDTHRFFDLSQELLIIRDFAGNYRYRNEAWAALLGYGLDELQMLPLFALVHPDDMAEAEQTNQRLQQGQTVPHIERRYRCKDGSYRCIFLRSIPFVTEGLIYSIGRDVTLQKQNEQEYQHTLEALRQSEQRLSLHLQQTALAVIEWGTDDRICAWNTGAEAMFGFTIAEAMGKNIFEFLIPPQAHSHVDVVREKMLAKQNVRGVNENLTKDGRVILCEWHNTPLINVDHEVIGFASFALDITERIQAEAQLKESEMRFRLVTENIYDMVCVHELDGYYLYISPSVKSMLGYEPEELEGKTPYGLVHAEDLQAFYRYYIGIYSHETVGSVNCRLLHKAGHYVWIEGYAKPVLDEDENIVRIVSSFRDISERKTSEKRIRESEERFRSLAENMHDLITLCDPQGRFLYVSPSFESLLGYRPEEVYGSASQQLVHPEDIEKFQWSLSQAISQEQTTDDVLFRVRKKDGTYIWLETRVNAILDEQGKVIRLDSLARDITMRKKAEELQRNAEAERIAREHSEASVKELRILNQLKDDFLSTVSHELRTPVTNIRMAIHMLKQGELTESQQLYITILEKECNREISLINDLLDLQRLETGSRPIACEVLMLQEWLSDVLTPFHSRIQEKEQVLEVMLAPELVYMITDRKSVERILVELVNNACKYTPCGEGIHVAIELNALGLVQLKVKNFGITIPAEELPRIFDKFYRVPTTDPWQQSGTGLGLSLVKEMITLLKGSVTVTSENCVTEFAVLLPQELI